MLLIEPVWNRNQNEADVVELYDMLLIEPVWNRNDTATVTADEVKAF